MCRCEQGACTRVSRVEGTDGVQEPVRVERAPVDVAPVVELVKLRQRLLRALNPSHQQ